MPTISGLKKEVEYLNYELDGMTKSTLMLNSEAENLDAILGMGKTSKNIKGIGYTSEFSNPKNVFVSSIRKVKTKMSGKMTQQAIKHYYHHTNDFIRPIWVCHAMVVVVTFILTAINCITTNYILNGN